MENAVRIVIECAKIYDHELAGKSVLFIYGSPEHAEYIECLFSKSNYLHLTGLIYKGSSATDFYRQCLARKLSPSNIALASNGTTRLKLEILPKIVNIHKCAKMIGTYNESKIHLYTEQLVGTQLGCIGFKLDNGYYVPNTAIREDIRNITTGTKRVLIILRKGCEDEKYNEVCYKAKGLNTDSFGIQSFILGKLEK